MIFIIYRILVHLDSLENVQQIRVPLLLIIIFMNLYMCLLNKQNSVNSMVSPQNMRVCYGCCLHYIH